MSKCDWKISKTKRRLADRRFIYRAKTTLSRLGVGFAAIAVAVMSLG